jgi:preprotein translocase subunit SecE
VATKEEEKPNVFSRIGNSIRHWFNESVGELRKVTWPTRREATNLTVVVLIVVFVMAIYLGALDFLFARAVALLFRG